MTPLQNEMAALLARCSDEATRQTYEKRLQTGNLCREENSASHFCASFVPFNPITKQVLIGDHKKSGLWLLPGGHIEPNEPLLHTLNREIQEELGVADFFSELPYPFLFTITHIVEDVRPCKEHFDIWFLLKTDGVDFVIDYSEYHAVRWVSLDEAAALTTDPATIQALQKLEGLFNK